MRLLKKITVAVVGGALLAIGIAMIVLPGPAILVIPAALGILALEFVWARRWLARVQKQVSSLLGKNANRS